MPSQDDFYSMKGRILIFVLLYSSINIVDSLNNVVVLQNSTDV